MMLGLDFTATALIVLVLLNPDSMGELLGEYLFSLVSWHVPGVKEKLGLQANLHRWSAVGLSTDTVWHCSKIKYWTNAGLQDPMPKDDCRE